MVDALHYDIIVVTAVIKVSNYTLFMKVCVSVMNGYERNHGISSRSSTARRAAVFGVHC